MKIRAVGHRVLVKPDDIEVKTEAGLFIVQDERREFVAQEYGTIVDIGPSAWLDFPGGPWASIGDRVIYSRYGGKLVREPGVTDIKDNYVILNDEDILAKLVEV